MTSQTIPIACFEDMIVRDILANAQTLRMVTHSQAEPSAQRVEDFYRGVHLYDCAGPLLNDRLFGKVFDSVDWKRIVAMADAKSSEMVA